MITKHTPGPWKRLGASDILGADGVVTASAKGWLDRKHPECHANAALIAAAPELLGALEDAVTYLHRDSESMFRRSLMELIARARGEV